MIGERYEYIIYMKNVAENVNFSLEELSSQNNSSRRTSRYRCEGIDFHKNTKNNKLWATEPTNKYEPFHFEWQGALRVYFMKI